MLFRSFLKSSRALAHHRPYAVLDMFGLVLGVAAFVVLILAARCQDGFDRWSRDAANVVRVDGFHAAPGRERQANGGALFMTVDRSRAKYARNEAGMQAVDNRHAGLHIEILNRCTVVFLYRVA